LGRPVEAAFGVAAGGWGIVEMAAASGLGLVAEGERDPWRSSSYGTGQLICAAVRAGCTEVTVGVGGSATVDGGCGAIAAIREAGGLAGSRLAVLSDVSTPWEQAAAVYGPQKGAGPELVTRLAARLDAFAAGLPRDPRGVPGSGAAGGLAGGLWAECGATLVPGAPFVLDRLAFDARLRSCDAVVCGEGRLDSQSGEGKIVGEIARRAGLAGVPVHAFVGRSEVTATEREGLGLASVTEAGSRAELEAAGARLGRLLLATTPAR
jgi:glycerate kinase